MQNQDATATSAFGFLEHLNQKLAEIPKKNTVSNRHKNREKHKNKKKEAQLEWRYEESISQHTMPITLLDLLTTSDSKSDMRDGPEEAEDFSPKRSLLIPTNTATISTDNTTENLVKTECG